MALLQGSTGNTGQRPLVGPPRSPESGSGTVLRSLLPVTSVPEQAINTDPSAETGADLLLDTGPTLDRGHRHRHDDGARGSDDAGISDRDTGDQDDDREDGARDGRDGGAADGHDGGEGDRVDGGDHEGLDATSPVARNRRLATLEDTLAQLSEAGPTPADVLEVLVTKAAALLDTPSRMAVVVGDQLLWTTASGDPGTPIGAEVDVDQTACGAAWKTGQIQHVTIPGLIDGPTYAGSTHDGPTHGGPTHAEPTAAEAAHGELSGAEAAARRTDGDPTAADPIDASETYALGTDCCGSPAAVLAVPLLRPGPPAAGRHANPSREVIAVLALIADRPGWFDDADIEVTADLAEVAGERIAVLTSSYEAHRAETAKQLDATPHRGDSLKVPSFAGARPREVPPAKSRTRERVTLHDHERAEGAARAAGEFDGWFVPVVPVTSTGQRPQLVSLVTGAQGDECGLGVEAADRPAAERLGVEAEADGRAVAPERYEPAVTPEADGQAAPERYEPAVTPALPRVPRARGRQSTAGMRLAPAMPPAMPAADSMGLWQWDATAAECTWSSPVARLLGLEPDAVLTLEQVREAVVAADRGRFDVAVQAIASGRGVAGALRLKTPDGRAKHAYAWSEVRRDDTGRLVGAWGGVVDVTAFEHDAEALRTGLAGLRAAQELTGLATWEWRPGSGQLIWSEEMYRLVGVSAENFSPTPDRWHAFIHPDDLDRARRLDLEADAQDSERVQTFRLIGPGGDIRHVQSWSTTSKAAQVRPTVYGATIDVTRQVHDRMMLERLSATDPVTGLGNRLAYDRRMQELLANASSGAASRAVTLILLDLDRFKVVNDSLGHQIGDRLLIEVARRLVAIVPEGSVTARMGGDEFVVVPPVGSTEPDIRRLAIGIVDALRAPYVLPGTGELLVCPASLGVAMSAGRQVSNHDLLREADIALYRAKDSGRDRFVIFDQALKARTQVRQSAELRLRSALEHGLLVMEYQPVVDFANGRIVGAEGLVRLRDTEEGDRLVGPDLFIDIAEQTGLVVELDSWVVQTAIEQLGQWRDQADGAEQTPWLAINLSVRSMENPRVVRRLIEAVKRGELPRDRIKIELAEQSFVGALPGVEAALRQLLANGIDVGIDDFGTGYSALAYLQHFDLDFMKIDRSFVASVGAGQRGDAVVTAIVDLAHAHGMRVIAEGVESGRQARRLREMGCDFAQGFHFGRPGEAARIVRG